MKKKSSNAKAGKPDPSPARWLRLGLVVALGAVAAGLGAWAMLKSRKPAATEIYVPRPRGQLTFTKDVSPIVFQQCAGCHRPGQSAPFALLGYQDVKKHASDIADVTARRAMPPWLPERGYGEFVGERRLSADQIGVIQQWVSEGAVEGAASDLAPLPRWSGDWQLGQPDLVVTMPQPYLLAAEGRDVYRNFVIPTTILARRYVRAIEFHPGNPKVVHHAFVKVDRSAQARPLDALDTEPGFPGMNPPAEMPDGHFLGWQPGRQPSLIPDGLAWRLDPGNDLVVQMHFNPSGKPEPVQASVGLFFTDRSPTNTCLKIFLTSYVLDIPAGESNYLVEDSYVLPVDAQVLAVLPHAHFLAKEMQGWATRPDGKKEPMLFIKQWDFNWQGDYRYAKPIFLPKGTTLSMRFIYDNSTNNTRNPNRPPKRVAYGAQSSDEMAELWFQLLPRDKTDLDLLTRHFQTKLARLFREHDEHALRKDPNDVKAHTDLGLALLEENNLVEAERHFRAAIQAQPGFAPGHYDLGLLLRRQNRLAEARAEFEATLRLTPQDFKAYGNLGFISLEEGDLGSAQAHFETALRLNPGDAMARAGLDDIAKAQAQRGKSK